MSGEFLQVTLQKLDKGGNISSERHRCHIGTTYFEAGTTVNDVLTFISERQRKMTGETGLWLLQTSSGMYAVQFDVYVSDVCFFISNRIEYWTTIRNFESNRIVFAVLKSSDVKFVFFS